MTFYVVLPILNQDMVGELDIPDPVHTDPIYGAFIDVTECSELLSHPLQKIIGTSIFFERAGWYPSVLNFHIRTLPVEIRSTN